MVKLGFNNMHIAPYEKTGEPFRGDSKRKRKLLLHKREINKILGYLTQKGLTAISSLHVRK